jgi:hypothetical protein
LGPANNNVVTGQWKAASSSSHREGFIKTGQRPLAIGHWQELAVAKVLESFQALISPSRETYQYRLDQELILMAKR